MKVVILCGGKGTRLREETEFEPKPMVEVGGFPVVWHIMQRYAKYGYKDFILALGYKAEIAKEYFYHYRMRNSDFTINLGNGDVCTHGQSEGFACENWRITLCDTGEDTLKGARIKRIARHIDTDQFMVTYGDGVADIDIAALIKFHEQSGKIGTFTGVRMPSRFGTVQLSIPSLASNEISKTARFTSRIWRCQRKASNLKNGISSHALSVASSLFSPDLTDSISLNSSALRSPDDTHHVYLSHSRIMPGSPVSVLS